MSLPDVFKERRKEGQRRFVGNEVKKKKTESLTVYCKKGLCSKHDLTCFKRITQTAMSRLDQRGQGSVKGGWARSYLCDSERHSGDQVMGERVTGHRSNDKLSDSGYILKVELTRCGLDVKWGM